ncbi:hypothetical protein [Pelomonas cellulosilytica]|uniref:Uncharacterized protein n=1 Tax=Pelomonas cellulosilytica TaxID=2906762 RepID=A0ABS8XUF8_9BURK|nr:hypothetical protein [Pelomonas sp. P8]MCE4554256.1 hypothetical protein [Pelomonas sp. P8]
MRYLLAASAALLVTMSTLAAERQPHVLRIRSLSEPVPLSAARINSGEFLGLDRIGRRDDGSVDLRILLVHGIGWTQNGSQPQFGTDLLRALQRSYGAKAVGFEGDKQPRCAQSKKTEDEPDYPVAGVDLQPVVEQRVDYYASDSPVTRMWSQGIGCLDRTTFSFPRGRVTLYRLVWDDAFYNAYSYPLVGYDDAIRSGHEQPQPPAYSGYEDLSATRRSGTSALRDNVMTYGLTDAALYMGPIGELMRMSVRGAICAAVNDATGRSDVFTPLIRKATVKTPALQEMQVEDLCGLDAPASHAVPLAIVAESLGSRMVFDVLSKERQEGVARKLNELPGSELEVYLLANQIPLLAAANLKPAKAVTPSTSINKTLRYIAISESDDLLSWELVPYFEHLYYMACRGESSDTRAPAFKDWCSDGGGVMQAVLDFKAGRKERKKYIEALGFEVIDVRTSFSPPASRLLNEHTDPEVAHTGYMRADEVRRVVMCGAAKGETNPACAIR